jgi:hypothetical protein
VIAFESRWHLAFFPFIGVPVCTGALYHDGWDWLEVHVLALSIRREFQGSRGLTRR